MGTAEESELVGTVKERELVGTAKERELVGTAKERESSCPQAAMLAHSPCLLLQELKIETIEKVYCPCQIFVDYIH